LRNVFAGQRGSNLQESFVIIKKWEIVGENFIEGFEADKAFPSV